MATRFPSRPIQGFSLSPRAASQNAATPTGRRKPYTRRWQYTAGSTTVPPRRRVPRPPLCRPRAPSPRPLPAVRAVRNPFRRVSRVCRPFARVAPEKPPVAPRCPPPPTGCPPRRSARRRAHVAPTRPPRQARAAHRPVREEARADTPPPALAAPRRARRARLRHTAANRRATHPDLANPDETGRLSRFAVEKCAGGRGDQIPVNRPEATAPPSRVNFRQIRGPGVSPQKADHSRLGGCFHRTDYCEEEPI